MLGDVLGEDRRNRAGPEHSPEELQGSGGFYSFSSWHSAVWFYLYFRNSKWKLFIFILQLCLQTDGVYCLHAHHTRIEDLFLIKLSLLGVSSVAETEVLSSLSVSIFWLKQWQQMMHSNFSQVAAVIPNRNTNNILFQDICNSQQQYWAHLCSDCRIYEVQERTSVIAFF